MGSQTICYSLWMGQHSQQNLFLLMVNKNKTAF
jgi:hypothetical protein